MALDANTVIGVIGAGAMGSGIAQVAAAAGHKVLLADAMPGAVEKARASITKSVARDLEKKRITSEAAEALIGRIEFDTSPLEQEPQRYRRCGLLIEAIVEDLDAKRTL